MKNVRTIVTILIIFLLSLAMFGCEKNQNTSLNNRFQDKESTDDPVKSTEEDDNGISFEFDQSTPTPYPENFFGKPDASGRVGYHHNLEQDKKNFDGKVDIVVGDKLFATQINDWYVNFNKYEGKVVEIEGYYINDYAPYTFIGRYGPSCPYCNGGYVSFEFYTEEDLSKLKSAKDWIKVTGILRSGRDKDGEFTYIEVLKLDVMDKVGVDTVTN